MGKCGAGRAGQLSSVTLVISGGQTGADQGGLLGARDAGVRTGGTAPRDWRTEDGAAPWLAEFGLVESQRKSYAARTRANAEAADGRSEEHTSELQSLMRISYAVFCL